MDELRASEDDLKDLVLSLITQRRRHDQVLEKARQTCRIIEERYSPRKRFERWRDSTDGRLWKEKQYRKQKHKCALCGRAIPLKGSHIDHIQPIKLSPNLACDVRNLHLTCPYCNQSKGASEVPLPTNDY